MAKGFDTYPNLRAEMARFGFEQKDLGRIVGVTKKTISDKINGKRDFTLGEIKKIRKECFPECSLDYLFAEEV